MNNLLHERVVPGPLNRPAAATRTDAALVLAARAGDKRAFVEVVARHQSMVCGIALGILGDFAASEDAAQEAFLTAWQKLGELREPEKLKSWLSQIAKNVALGHGRRRKGEATLDEEPELADQMPGPDELAAKSEENALVCEYLAKLPETYRLPLVLYYREGQSVHAVAETLSLSEDAVRQRLARGREMLRERMAKLVEAVLTRTAPTAAFTVAVAAAIGALAAPSAVASGVFAASASASSTTASSATNTASFLGLMSAKTFVAAAFVLLVSVPVGYGIRLVRPSAPVSDSPGPQIALAPAPTSPPQFENSAWYAQWRQLHQTYGTGSQAMPLLFKAINDFKDDFQRRAFSAALISEWVQVDPAGAFAFFSADGHTGGQRRQVFEEWLARDPQATVKAFLAAGKPWKTVVHELLPEIAKAAPAQLADVVGVLPKSDNYWDNKVRDAFATVAASDVTLALTAAEGLAGPNRQQALEGVARAWAKSDPTAAVAWAKQLPDVADRDEIIRSALVGLAAMNPAAALDQVGIVPPGGQQMYFASTTGARVLSAAVQTDFDGTVAWIAAHPGKLSSEDLLGMAQAVTSRLNADPAGFLSSRSADGSLAGIVPAIGSALLNGSADQRGAVWDWLQTQPENDTTKALKDQVLNASAWQDPSLAISLANHLPATPEGDKEIRTLAQSLLNGGSMLYRFDGLYSQAPDRLRQPLLETAFNLLRADNLDNPQTWLARIPQLPSSDQPSAQSSVARAWAERSPEDAMTWAQSLPAASGRDQVEASVVSTWAASDSVSAGAWVSSLSPGPERDQSTRALAFALSDIRPVDAWNWALSIGDESTRTATATHVAQLMASRDINTARQWIDASSLPAATKAQLQAALNAGNQAVGP